MPEHDGPDEPVPAPEDLARIADLVRSVSESGTTLDQPPPDLWASIAAAVEADESPQPAGRGVPVDRSRSAAVQPLRRRLWPAGVAAAASVLVVALVVTSGGDDGPTDLASTELANDGLDPTGSGLAGRAELVERDGSFAVDLELPELPAVDGYYEVWIIDTEVAGMHSLGSYQGDGEYVLPAGVEPADYPIVDVSIEPADGQPVHSGVSILRGVLEL